MEILIRDIPDDIANALKVKASEDGMDRQAWIRQQLIRLAAQPTIKSRYSFKAFGPEGSYAQIRREADGLAGQGSKNCSQAQLDAYKKAVEYAQRNELGDYEAAYKLLLSNFDEVFAN
jgi:hypothetical protein